MQHKYPKDILFILMFGYAKERMDFSFPILFLSVSFFFIFYIFFPSFLCLISIFSIFPLSCLSFDPSILPFYSFSNVFSHKSRKKDKNNNSNHFDGIVNNKKPFPQWLNRADCLINYGAFHCLLPLKLVLRMKSHKGVLTPYPASSPE